VKKIALFTHLVRVLSVSMRRNREPCEKSRI
jgi:hypothetical protein